MNLVNELQVGAVRDDVLTVLRNARRLASKLGVDDINHWLQSEQQGYKAKDAIPSYRVVKCTIRYQSSRPVPLGFGMFGHTGGDMSGFGEMTLSVGDPMAALLDMTKEGETTSKMIGYPVPDEIGDQLRRQFHEFVENAIYFFRHPNFGQMMAIPEIVKDRVMEWALALERRGVCGDGQSFNDREKAVANSIVFNLNNCHVEQLTNSGTNRRITDG